MSHDLRIVQADTPARLDLARALFSEYAAALGFKSCFRNFDQELAGLPGRYAPPEGRLLLAYVDDGAPGSESPAGRATEGAAGGSTAGTAAGAAGCGGLWRLDDGACELRRLFVRPAWRGHGLGRALALALVEEARRAGYTCMRLETLPSMKEAVSLYPSLGFRPIEPYIREPFDGAIYMEKDLAGATAAPRP